MSQRLGLARQLKALKQIPAFFAAAGVAIAAVVKQAANIFSVPALMLAAAAGFAWYLDLESAWSNYAPLVTLLALALAVVFGIFFYWLEFNRRGALTIGCQAAHLNIGHGTGDGRLLQVAYDFRLVVENIGTGPIIIHSIEPEAFDEAPTRPTPDARVFNSEFQISDQEPTLPTKIEPGETQIEWRLRGKLSVHDRNCQHADLARLLRNLSTFELTLSCRYSVSVTGGREHTLPIRVEGSFEDLKMSVAKAWAQRVRQALYKKRSFRVSCGSDCFGPQTDLAGDLAPGQPAVAVDGRQKQNFR